MRRWLPVFFCVAVAPAWADEPRTPRLIEKPEAFQTLVNPNCSHCIDESKRRATELRDDDRVLCWTRGKYEGGAIPFRFFLNPYRVISDTYGTFVYDPDGGYARAFTASLDFRFHGWRNGVMVMKHKDGTLYSCLSGVAFDGPRKGDKLTPWPTVVTDWGWYLKHYPGGVAYHMYDKYKPLELPTAANPDALKSRGAVDPRLGADDLVLGLAPTDPEGTGLALAIAELERFGQKPGLQAITILTEEMQGGRPAKMTRIAYLVWQGSTRTAAAYIGLAENRAPTQKLSAEGALIGTKAVNLQADGKSDAAPFVDADTGSRFDITGRCVAGELKGWTLRPLDAVMVKWHAWSAEYPKTVLLGK